MFYMNYCESLMPNLDAIVWDGCLRVEGPHKAEGLDLSQHHGAQAEGLCGMGEANKQG